MGKWGKAYLQVDLWFIYLFIYFKQSLFPTSVFYQLHTVLEKANDKHTSSRRYYFLQSYICFREVHKAFTCFISPICLVALYTDLTFLLSIFSSEFGQYRTVGS